MMKMRLLLGKRLLKPDGVLIITIDENELYHLGVLLEMMFPSRLRHMVTIVVNPKGAGKRNFARTEEHALFTIPNTGNPVVDAKLLKDLARVGLTEELIQEEEDEEQLDLEDSSAEADKPELPYNIAPEDLPDRKSVV